MNYIIFYNISTFVHYIWRDGGIVPLSGWGWAENGEVTDKESSLFKELETNKKRTFELKDKGKFAILQRGQFKTDTDDTRDDSEKTDGNT